MTTILSDLAPWLILGAVLLAWHWGAKGLRRAGWLPPDQRPDCADEDIPLGEVVGWPPAGMAEADLPARGNARAGIRGGKPYAGVR